MSPLIKIQELLLSDPQLTVIVDARGGADAYERYLQGHIQDAIFADLDNDLAAKVEDASQGGRHPLPSTADFAALLTRLGITAQTHVIVYDDKAGANSAARLWWMLKAIGHEVVQVLDGGLQAAIDYGVTLSTDAVNPKQVDAYPVPVAFTGTVNIEEVTKAAHDPSRLVIDVRENARYLGRTEPLDLIAGHIPGAVNVPYASNLEENNTYRSADALKTAYEETFGGVKPEDVIVHCGSGVTACHTLLALEHAGIKSAKLYVGSWSEWSRRDLPIGKEERY